MTEQMGLAGIMLSETSQTEKDKCKHHDIMYMWNLKNKINDMKHRNSFIGTENRLMDARGDRCWGGR